MSAFKFVRLTSSNISWDDSESDVIPSILLFNQALSDQQSLSLGSLLKGDSSSDYYSSSKCLFFIRMISIPIFLSCPTSSIRSLFLYLL